MSVTKEREFSFTTKDFKFLADLVFEKTGIVLKDNKFEMVYARLARRLRKLNLDNFKDYIQLFTNKNSDTELAFLVDAITTNLTKFFREQHQFKDLASNVLDQAIEDAKNGSPKKLRIWSAGCSAGQEAYSLAMIIASYIKDYESWDILILASDIDRNMLEKGKNAIYTAAEVESLPPKFAKKFIQKTKDNNFTIDKKLKKMVRFKPLNLLHKWPIKDQFDAIFCRNVVIYFDNETKENLITCFCEKLKDDGMLYLGHSEALISENKYLKSVGKAAFRRVSV